MIYSADSIALAVLETLVHARKDQIPDDYVFYEIDLDDDSVEVAKNRELPADWTSAVPQDARTFGTEWMKSRRSIALLVPSFVIRQELNLLLNAEHSEFLRVRVTGPQPFKFDSRLFR
jgi:RES domain-containing protein